MERPGIKADIGTIFILLFSLMLHLIPMVMPIPGSGEGARTAEEGARGGRTIIVDDGGGGDHKTIQAAIDAANSGDTIHVWAGTYNENVIVNKMVTLIGNGSGNTVVDGGGEGDLMIINSDWVNVSGFRFTNAEDVGIEVQGIDHARLRDNFYDFNGYGIYLYYSNNSVLENNTCNNNSGYGISLYKSNSNSISNNTCNNSPASGIKLYKSDSNSISNNTCDNNSDNGIYLYKSDSNSISNNACSNNGNDGIYIYYSRSNTFKNNTMVDGGLSIKGRRMISWNTHSIDTSNTVNGKPIYYLKNATGGTVPTGAGQVILANCTGVTVKDQYISNIRNGIQLVFSDVNTVKNNTCNNNSDDGIYLYDSDSNSISNNTCNNNSDDGIYLYNGDSNSISNNTCNNNSDDGIYLKYSDRNSISNNTYRNNSGDGISLTTSSDSNSISNNTCSNNSGDGISLWSSDGNSISNNPCNNNSNNGIYLYDSDGNSISNNTCYHNSGAGIYISSWDNNKIANNICNNNSYNGITIFISDNNLIDNNICNGNSGNGIYLKGSDGNTVTNNIAVSNGGSGIAFFKCSRNIYISNNILSYNYLGGQIANRSYDNIFFNNIFTSNIHYGVSIAGETGKNILHYNKFIQNNQGGIQASDNGTGNRWHSSQGGNYWSDWTGPDQDMDGIVDKAYLIAGMGRATDPLPLVVQTGMPVPRADAGGDIDIGQHEAVTFDSSKCSYPRCIVNYSWSFIYDNEPTFLYGPNPSFTFEKSGEYGVTLSVLNSRGQGTNDTMKVRVKDTEPPVIDMAGNITVNQYETFTFSAENCSDNMGIDNYTWNLYYGGYFYQIYGPTPSFTFQLVGEFVVKLTVMDKEENRAEDTVGITVLDTVPPYARAGKDCIEDQGETVTFIGNHSIDNVGITHFVWSFRYDNSDVVLSGITANFTFELPGHFPVTLTVFDAVGNSDTDMLNVTVRDITAPRVDPGGDIVVEANDTVRFNGSGSKDEVGIANWTWKFEYGGRDMELYGPEPEFRFKKPGEYRVYLHLTDESGNSAREFMRVTVNGSGAEPGNSTPFEEGNESPDHSEEEGTNEKHFSIYSWWPAVLGVIVMIAVAIFAYKRLDKDGGTKPDGTGRDQGSAALLERLVVSESEGPNEDDEECDMEGREEDGGETQPETGGKKLKFTAVGLFLIAGIPGGIIWLKKTDNEGDNVNPPEDELGRVKGTIGDGRGSG